MLNILTKSLRGKLPTTPEAPGELITLEDRTTHIIRGQGTLPTPYVVLESALGCPSTEWISVQRELTTMGIKSMSYDRPGLGWSPSLKSADTAQEHWRRLSILLEHLGIGDVVLVGHSVGGLLTRSFQRREPERVRGMVFIDSTHPAQHVRSSRQEEGLRIMRKELRSAIKRPSTAYSGGTAKMPDPFGCMTHTIASQPSAIAAARREVQRWLSDWATDAAEAGDVGATPIAVVTAGEMVKMDPAHRVLQAELASLSDDSTHEIIDGADHQELVMDPQFSAPIARAIANVIGRGRHYEN